MINFIKSEDGASTVEFVLWFMTIFFVILFAYDLSVISMKRAMFNDHVRLVARNLSVGEHANTGEAKDAVEDFLGQYIDPTKLDIDVTKNNNWVVVSATTKVRFLANMTGGFSGNREIRFASIMPLEQNL